MPSSRIGEKEKRLIARIDEVREKCITKKIEIWDDYMKLTFYRQHTTKPDVLERITKCENKCSEDFQKLTEIYKNMTNAIEILKMLIRFQQYLKNIDM